VTHLGDRVAALVDGQLPPEAIDRATMHLASCRPCRDLVELERLTKARLVTLVGPAPAPDFIGRLLAMGGPAGPLPPRRGHVPGTPRPEPVPLRPPVSTAVRTTLHRRPGPSTRPAGRPGVLTARRTRLAAVVLGALSVMGVGVGGIAVGTSATGASSRTVQPSLDMLTSSGGTSLISTTLTGSSTSPIDLFRSTDTQSIDTQRPILRPAVRP
jgi:Putative zinc-finger